MEVKMSFIGPQYPGKPARIQINLSSALQTEVKPGSEVLRKKLMNWLKMIRVQTERFSHHFADRWNRHIQSTSNLSWAGNAKLIFISQFIGHLKNFSNIRFRHWWSPCLLRVQNAAGFVESFDQPSKWINGTWARTETVFSSILSQCTRIGTSFMIATNQIHLFILAQRTWHDEICTRAKILNSRRHYERRAKTMEYEKQIGKKSLNSEDFCWKFYADFPQIC